MTSSNILFYLTNSAKLNIMYSVYCKKKKKTKKSSKSILEKHNVEAAKTEILGFFALKKND